MRILNLGSLNYDKVYEMDHFIQEAETLLCKDYGEFLGGKGLNQSLALARAGAEVYHAGAIGTDGDLLKDCLDAAGVDTRYLQKKDTVSGHAIIQRSKGQNCIIVYGGANRCISREYITEVLADFGPGDLLLLQNEIPNVDFAIEQAKARGMEVAFNASPITEEILNYPLSLVDYFIINEVEGKALSEINSDDYEEIITALAEKFPAAAIVLTVGEHGVLYQRGNEKLKQAVFKVPVVDTTAAGDTFCGYFLTCIAKGLSVREALRIAGQAGALAVSRDGAAASIPTWSEVQQFGAERA